MGKKNNVAKKLRRKIKNLGKRRNADIKQASAVSTSRQRTPVLIGFDEKKVFDLAIDIWKLEKNIKKILDVDENRPVKSSLNKVHEYIASYKIETIDYDGEKYHENLNIKILSTEILDDVTEPMILETVKPAVLVNGVLVSHASVIIAAPQNT